MSEQHEQEHQETTEKNQRREPNLKGEGSMSARKRSAKRGTTARASMSAVATETAKRGGTVVTNSVFNATGVQHTEHSIKGTVALAQACEANARALLEIAQTMNGSRVTVGPILHLGAS